jgi:hypothetical protein
VTLHEEIQTWVHAAERKWEVLPMRLAIAVRQSTSGRALDAVKGWELQIASLAIATPERVAVECGGLAAALGRAIQEAQATWAAGDELTASMVGLVDLANALECVGLRLRPEFWDVVRKWLAQSPVAPRLERASRCTVRLAALSLGLDSFREPTAPRLEPDALEAFVSYLTTAVRGDEQLGAHWDDFLRQYPVLRDEHAIDESSLLWFARIVNHRIGGHAIGDVAQCLHGALWRQMEVGCPPETLDISAG